MEQINKSKTEYIERKKEIKTFTKEFNLLENNILSNIFKVINDNIKCLFDEIKRLSALYEENKSKIQNLNKEPNDILILEKKFNIKYKFEEYRPANSDVNNKNDSSVIPKIHKAIGLELDKIISIDKNTSNDKDNNIIYIILMDKFINDENDLDDKEKYFLKNLFKSGKYINELLTTLNTIRNKKDFIHNRKKYDILLVIFREIIEQVSFSDEKDHEIVKLLLILMETFYYYEGEKKIFLNNIIKLPNEIKDNNFWINYIEIEIQNEYEKNKNKKKKPTRIEYIIFVSNIIHLKEYVVKNEKISQILQYFQDKYKFSVQELEVIQNQLKI